MTKMTFKERDSWMRAVARDDRLTAMQRLVALRMALFLRVDTGELPFKWDCLHAALGYRCSLGSLSNAMKTLERLGWVVIVRPGRGQQNQYLLTLPAALKIEPEKSEADAALKTGAYINEEEDKRYTNLLRANARLEHLKNKQASKPAEETPTPPTPALPAVVERRTFCEWDYLSEDEVVFFSMQEIGDLAQDCPGIRDIRAAIRNADRYFKAREVEANERKAAVLAMLAKKSAEGLDRQAEMRRKTDAAIERDKRSDEQKQAEREARGERWRTSGGNGSFHLLP